MVYSSYTKLRIVHYVHMGCKSSMITSVLKSEGLKVSVSEVAQFIRKYKVTGTIRRRHDSGRLLYLVNNVR